MNRVQIFVIATSILLLVFVLELVRRRRLREEYSWLWLVTALGYATIAIFPRITRLTADIVGAENSSSVFILAGFLFLFLICIQFSVRLSRLSDRNKELAQMVAILDSEVRRLTEAAGEAVPTIAERSRTGC
ncbi:MAG: DUF2304 domain-containing protein [Anaerolineales bacterium]|nr:DUF2304 domain-containing protein [Anaerolineales bacterium]